MKNDAVSQRRPVLNGNNFSLYGMYNGSSAEKPFREIYDQLKVGEDCSRFQSAGSPVPRSPVVTPLQHQRPLTPCTAAARLPPSRGGRRLSRTERPARPARRSRGPLHWPRAGGHVGTRPGAMWSGPAPTQRRLWRRRGGGSEPDGRVSPACQKCDRELVITRRE